MLASYREWVDVGEGKIGLENLCLNLDDYQFSVSVELRATIRDACERLGVEPHYWATPPAKRGSPGAFLT